MRLFNLSETELEVKNIEPVEDDEYDERVRAVVEISHPELETIVVKYHVTRGLKQDETDEIREGVEYHVNPGKRFDLSSLVHETYISFEPDEYLQSTTDALIDGVRASIRQGHTEVVIDDLLNDPEIAG